MPQPEPAATLIEVLWIDSYGKRRKTTLDAADPDEALTRMSLRRSEVIAKFVRVRAAKEQKR